MLLFIHNWSNSMSSSNHQFGKFGLKIDKLELKKQNLRNKSFWCSVAILIVGTYNISSYGKYGANMSTYFLSLLGLMALTAVLYFYWKEYQTDKTLDQKHLERIDGLFKKK